MLLTNILQSTIYGNTPNGSGSYLRPKTHIQHTQAQHLSTTTQTSTNHKKHSLHQGGVKRRRHSWLSIKQLWDRLWSMPLLYDRLLHPRPAVTNCKSCRTQHWELPQDAHKTQTYTICMMKHSHSPYTNTYNSTPHNTNRKHNILHIPYTNTQPTLTLQGPRFLTTAATQQTFPQNPTQSLQQT